METMIFKQHRNIKDIIVFWGSTAKGLHALMFQKHLYILIPDTSLAPLVFLRLRPPRQVPTNSNKVVFLGPKDWFSLGIK